jgi:hypothetical protein
MNEVVVPYRTLGKASRPFTESKACRVAFRAVLATILLSETLSQVRVRMERAFDLRKTVSGG